MPRHATKRYKERPNGLGDVVYIVIHHSGPVPLDMTAEEAAMMTANYVIRPHGPGNEEWPGEPYHAIIVPSGDWAYCQSLRTISYHVGPYNGQAVGVCLWGDYRNEPVPAIMVDSLEEVCRWIMREKINWAEDAGIIYLPPLIVGHRQLTATACPGDYGMLAIEEVRRRLQWA